MGASKRSRDNSAQPVVVNAQADAREGDIPVSDQPH